MSQELHEHQGLVDVAHAHAFRDVVAQALVGGGGGWGHEGILALWGPVLGRCVTGGGTRRAQAPAITLTHECSPMQTKRSLTKPRSATTCSQTRIQSVASRPGYFVHSATPLNPGGDFVMICSTMGRLGPVQRIEMSAYGMKVVISATLKGPNGASRPFRTVWLIHDQSRQPRLVTAFPE